MLLSRTKATEWAPQSDEDIQRVQKQIGRMLRRKYPTFPPKIIEDEIAPNAFSDGYVQYLEVISDDSCEEIENHEQFMVVVCYNLGERLIRSSVRLHKREEMLPLMDESTEDRAGIRSMESVMGDEIAAIEKSSPASQALKSEQRNALLTTVAALTPKQRDAFLRVVVHGEKQKDAAVQSRISLKVFEKRLRTAIAKVAFGVAQHRSDAMCGEYQGMVQNMADPHSPSKSEHDKLLRHLFACSACRDAVYDTPFAIDVGALLATGLFTTHVAPSVGERIASSPFIEGPAELINRITPGGGHGAEAAAGASGAGAGGVGGTALVVGGGKAVVALCAGAATTACVVGAATGVIPITAAKSDKSEAKPPAIERTAPAALLEANRGQSSLTQYRTAYHQDVVQKKAAKRAAARQEAKAQQVAQQQEEQLSYTSPTTSSAPTTQSATNTSSADSSFGIAPSSGGGSTSSAPPPAQVQTNQSSADASMGFP